MTRKELTRGLAVLAFCACSTSLLSTAHAGGFLVVADCHGEDGFPDWSHSPNTIKVEAFINNAYLHIGSFTAPITSCDADNEIGVYFPGFSFAEVSKLRLTTNGTNVFFLDKLYLVNGDDLNDFAQWEIEDNRGYCFSKQSGDGVGPYCIGARAYTSLVFTL